MEVRSRQGPPPPGFHVFPRLPPELRSQIWGHRLQVQRLLVVKFVRRARYSEQRQEYPQGPEPDRVNPLGRSVASWPSEFTIDGSLPADPLLLVNHEARSIALDFYRVHHRVRIPFDVHGAVTGGGSVNNIRTFNFNPEHDILHLKLSTPYPYDHHLSGIDVAAFLHNAAAYDPKGVGVRNLALGPSIDVYFLSMLQPSYLTPATSAATRRVLDNLWCFYCVILPHTRPGTRPGHHPPSDCILHPNHSVPIVVRNRPFGEPRRELRPIAADLAQVDLTLCGPPARVMALWNEVERRFDVNRDRARDDNSVGVGPPPPSEPDSEVGTEAGHKYEEKFILGLWPDESKLQVDSRESLNEYLRLRDKSATTEEMDRDPFNDSVLRPGRIPPVVHRRANNELERVGGFWILHRDSFNGLPVRKGPVDLSNCVPELAEFDLGS